MMLLGLYLRNPSPTNDSEYDKEESNERDYDEDQLEEEQTGIRSSGILDLIVNTMPYT